MVAQGLERDLAHAPPRTRDHRGDGGIACERRVEGEELASVAEKGALALADGAPPERTTNVANGINLPRLAGLSITPVTVLFAFSASLIFGSSSASFGHMSLASAMAASAPSGERQLP